MKDVDEVKVENQIEEDDTQLALVIRSVCATITCMEDSMRHHCPICCEDSTVMKCGHTMHCECYHELIKREKCCCPIRSKSIMDMSRTWKRIDEEIEATVMPDEYRYEKVWILCNGCNDTTEVYFRIIGQKCGHCEVYNTRTIAPPVLPQ